jgi:hypothetical protein
MLFWIFEIVEIGWLNLVLIWISFKIQQKRIKEKKNNWSTKHGPTTAVSAHLTRGTEPARPCSWSSSFWSRSRSKLERYINNGCILRTKQWLYLSLTLSSISHQLCDCFFSTSIWKLLQIELNTYSGSHFSILTPKSSKLNRCPQCQSSAYLPRSPSSVHTNTNRGEHPVPLVLLLYFRS